MQNYQAIIEDLDKCTVAIQEAGSSGRILGTGVIVTDDGLILTCFHVVGDIKNKIINNNSIDVYFPEFKITKSASVVNEYCDPSIDVAFFKIENGSLSNSTTVSNLGEGIIFGHKFASIGFRKPKVFEKLSSSGEIRIKTSFKTKEDIESPQLIQLYSDEIEPGMSGAPILDLETNKVVGIVSEHWVSASNNVDTRLNFGIPIESILKVPAIESMLRERNPGLKKIHQFMEKIGLGKSKIYQRFDDVYVAPTEYNEIEGTLRENNCVFITGTAEYGKTFTAIKLLWEYSKKDIIPKYIPEEAKEESKDIIKKLKNQDEDLQHTVIYLEDPIGKYKYESNPEFESSFVDIIESLHDLNIYLIITSREEIYQQFRPIGGLDTITKKFVKKLNIGKRSYDYEKRKEMLTRWAAIYRCRWLEDGKLKNMIFETIKNNDAKLSTPLNIKDFAYASRYESSNAIVLDSKKGEGEELIKILDRKSERTPEVFAEEIKDMEPEKILFLCFLFVSGRFPIEFIKEKYKELVNELANEFKIGEGEDALKFERVLDSFRDSSKVDTSYDVFLNKYTLRFSHPSYYEAILLMISKNGAFKLSRKILSVVLLKLFSTSSEVALIVASNFDKLPENVQSLLSKIPENKQTAGLAAFAIAANFEKLPENVRNLLFKLAENKETAGLAALVIGVNFDNLPDNVRNLLFKLAENKDTARDVAYTIADNYDRLPDTVRNLLFKLAENKEIAASVAFAISFCFDRLPENVLELLFELAENKDTARDVADVVIWNYKLPENVRKILLFKLANNNKEIAASVADVVAYNFDRLPENVRNELFKLAGNKEASGNISYAVAKYFDKLPDNVRNELLLKPADHKETARYIAWFTAYNFSNLPYNVRNYLFMFTDDKETAAIVADAIAWQFDKLPENVQNLLFKLAENKETASSVSDAVAKHFDKLPENVRNELLPKLSDSYNAN